MVRLPLPWKRYTGNGLPITKGKTLGWSVLFVTPLGLRSGSAVPFAKPRWMVIEMIKIVKNAIQCKLCGDIIESKYRHDYVICSCGACSVDGGLDYLRRGFKEKDCYIELSQTEKVE